MGHTYTLGKAMDTLTTILAWTLSLMLWVAAILEILRELSEPK